MGLEYCKTPLTMRSRMRVKITKEERSFSELWITSWREINLSSQGRMLSKHIIPVLNLGFSWRI